MSSQEDAKDPEILVHISAPGQARDDECARKLAAAYTDFQSASRQAVYAPLLLPKTAGRQDVAVSTERVDETFYDVTDEDTFLFETAQQLRESSSSAERAGSELNEGATRAESLARDLHESSEHSKTVVDQLQLSSDRALKAADLLERASRERAQRPSREKHNATRDRAPAAQIPSSPPQVAQESERRALPVGAGAQRVLSSYYEGEFACANGIKYIDDPVEAVRYLVDELDESESLQQLLRVGDDTSSPLQQRKRRFDEVPVACEQIDEDDSAASRRKRSNLPLSPDLGTVVPSSVDAPEPAKSRRKGKARERQVSPGWNEGGQAAQFEAHAPSIPQARPRASSVTSVRPSEPPTLSTEEHRRRNTRYSPARPPSSPCPISRKGQIPTLLIPSSASQSTSNKSQAEGHPSKSDPSGAWAPALNNSPASSLSPERDPPPEQWFSGPLPPTTLDLRPEVPPATPAMLTSSSLPELRNLLLPRIIFKRSLRPWERGHWRIDMRKLSLEQRLSSWDSLKERTLRGDLGYWVNVTREIQAPPHGQQPDFVSAEYESDFDLVRVYCPGGLVVPVFCLINAAFKNGEEETERPGWIDADRKGAVEIRPSAVDGREFVHWIAKRSMAFRKEEREVEKGDGKDVDASKSRRSKGKGK